MGKDFSLSAVVAGFVAVLVGFTSSVVIVFQAAAALGATPEQTASWIWALGLGMGLCQPHQSSRQGRQKTGENSHGGSLCKSLLVYWRPPGYPSRRGA